jgi:simple sugar transport system permease protein
MDLDFKKILQDKVVSVLFMVLIIVGLFITKETPSFLMNEIVGQFLKHIFLVLALLIPIRAGMGFNFSIVIGAMAGQLAIIMAVDNGFSGISSFLMAVVFATPIAILLGFITGIILNRARGYEMVASLFFNYFMNGIYQMICLFLAGVYIPIKTKDLLLQSGTRLRNTVDLKANMGEPLIPLVLFALLVGILVLISWLIKNKFDNKLDITSDKYRVMAIMLSLILAAWGQIIYLQSSGVMFTYGSHMGVGNMAVIALIMGGATVHKAGIKHAIIGTFLFQFVLILLPSLFESIFENGNLYEVLRMLIYNGVIVYAFIQSRNNIERTPQCPNYK